jgi:adenylylsulfate kinase-like enzyme
MIYWLTGPPSQGKSSLGKKLHQLLSTEKRNWRKDVFLIDEASVKDYSKTDTEKTTNCQMMAEYLHNCGCDVVVDLYSPSKDVRERFKKRIGVHRIQEFYCYSNSLKEENYQEPTDDFLGVDTTRDTPTQSFNKIIYYLTENNKL